jgi:hypothetical protein
MKVMKLPVISLLMDRNFSCYCDVVSESFYSVILICDEVRSIHLVLVHLQFVGIKTKKNSSFNLSNCFVLNST